MVVTMDINVLCCICMLSLLVAVSLGYLRWSFNGKRGKGTGLVLDSMDRLVIKNVSV